MTKYTNKKLKPSPGLRRIGLWATWWWTISWVYLLLLVWQSRDFYVNRAATISSTGFFSDWLASMNSTYRSSALLPSLLALIIIVWAIGGWMWLRELKRSNNSFVVGLKDLFFTIR
ncbi:hypothetical protein H0V99_03520 [Candidatus Saccharibacteria bacterium]|nr:hypothetical protein [Candidatus Saccharibacteria bacterium]